MRLKESEPKRVKSDALSIGSKNAALALEAANGSNWPEVMVTNSPGQYYKPTACMEKREKRHA